MSMIVKLIVGVVLFAGSLVGGLAATGRLNHEGTANIPLLSSLFPAPPPETGDPTAEAPGKDGANAANGSHAADGAKDAHATPSGETQRQPTEGAHSPHTGEQAQDANAQNPDAERRQKTGRSLNATEPKADAHGGGGHGAEPAADAHGKDASKDAHGKDAAKAGKSDQHTETTKPAATNGHGSPEGDFQHLQSSLAGGKSQYTPGDLFRFQGLPAGVTPEQINDAWQRVQGLMNEIERRKVTLDQQETLQREQVEDISRRQASLAKERVEIEQMHRDLDAKIAKFKEQVKLVRNDEVPALRQNAQSLAAFEPEKAAQLLEAQWKSDKGQDYVLKVLSVMDKDAVNAILAVMPPALAQEVMQKRLRVSKESASSGKGG
jgi:hypothetical protein